MNYIYLVFSEFPPRKFKFDLPVKVKIQSDKNNVPKLCLLVAI